eukprot:m51a1_g2067 hypothetical protein (244) ;mRNA; f:1444397-1445895
MSDHGAQPPVDDSAFCCSQEVAAAAAGVGPATFAQALARVLSPDETSQPLYRVFEGKGPPTVPVTDYINRVAYYIPQCSPTMWVTALLYIDRLLKLNQGLSITYYNIHRIILGSVICALKFHEDKTYGNDYFARVGGVPVPELNSIEAMFLQLLKWELYVNPVTFAHAAIALSKIVAEPGPIMMRRLERRASRAAGVKPMQQVQMAAVAATAGAPAEGPQPMSGITATSGSNATFFGDASGGR